MKEQDHLQYKYKTDLDEGWMEESRFNSPQQSSSSLLYSGRLWNPNFIQTNAQWGLLPKWYILVYAINNTDWRTLYSDNDKLFL
jgi:hypothetical protein